MVTFSGMSYNLYETKIDIFMSRRLQRAVLLVKYGTQAYPGFRPPHNTTNPSIRPLCIDTVPHEYARQVSTLRAPSCVVQH
jgi:hypothetical protein